MGDAFSSSGLCDFLQQANGYDWTADPNTRLVAAAAEVARLKVQARERLAELIAPDGGALLREYGERVEALAGWRDFSFFETLPAAGTEVILLRVLCPLYELTLADGPLTLSGGFIDSFERVTGITIIRSNISGMCHRKGKGGVELKRGQAGCVNPTGKTLAVLTDVKELQFYGLQAAGLKVIGIIASSQASIASFFGNLKPSPFTLQRGKGPYTGMTIACTPHTKFVSPTCANSKAVALSLNAPLGDTLAVSSRCVEGWAKVAVRMMALRSASSEQAQPSTRAIYDMLRNDEQSGAVAREWDHRHSTTTSPEVQAKLKEEMRKKCAKGGETDAYPETKATWDNPNQTKWQRNGREYSVQPTIDKMYRVEFSIDNGATYQPLETVNPRTRSDSDGGIQQWLQIPNLGRVNFKKKKGGCRDKQGHFLSTIQMDTSVAGTSVRLFATLA